jgi:type IV pilus assembly protein PilM
MSQFIKDIFLPEKIGQNYLFSKYIVSVAIGKTSIIATKAYIKGNDITVQMIVEEKIEMHGGEEQETDPVSNALKLLFAKIGPYDEVRTIISSSLVIFKELKLPFINREKIEMVVGFEIEPLLPFPLRDAVVDFAIITQNSETKSSDILVTAIQKQHVSEHLSIFETAGITVDKITVDALSLYSLYTAIPSYNSIEGGTALIDVGLHTTRIMLMIDSKLKMIRTLPKGIITVTKKAAADLGITPNEVMEKLIRFGLEAGEPSDYAQKIEAAVGVLWDDINFTFASFTQQFLHSNAMTKIIMLGDGVLIKGFLASFAQKINSATEEFSIESLQEIKRLHIPSDIVVSPITVVSLSGVIETPVTQDYNLEHVEFTKPNYALLIKQLVVAIVLTVAILATLITHYSIQTSKLNKELAASQKEVLTELHNTFKNLDKNVKLYDAIESAEEEVAKQKETWFAFSNPNHATFLQYLLELTNAIDVRSTGLDIEQVSLTESEMILKARVNDYEALKILERELSQSKLFSYVTPQETLQFTMRIVLAPQLEEEV